MRQLKNGRSIRPLSVNEIQIPFFYNVIKGYPKIVANRKKKAKGAAAKGAIYYVTIAAVISSCVKINKLLTPVKISYFRAKAHLVFHWCLYNKHLLISWKGSWW